MSWTDRAACTDADPEIFFPASEDPVDRVEAIAICSICPVVNDCLEYALAHGETYGIWGGKTGRQRARILRARNRAARRTA